MQVDKTMIHPELRTAGAGSRLVFSGFSKRTFHMANFVMRARKGRCKSPLQYEQIYLPRADGSVLRLCVYSPISPRECVPGVLWLHGGGYAMGCPEQDEKIIKRFIDSSACLVVAPDYRLSLDAPYPAALEDCYAALLWLKTHGREYGMRDDQIMVGGVSAGGGLAAAVTLYARDKGDVAIAYQMPLYPMMDDKMDTPSARDNDAPVWNTKSSDIGWRLYLGDWFGMDDVPVYAAPARCVDLTGLPPVCSFVGSIDPFRDETVGHMERLRAAGTEVEYQVFEGCFHGFDTVFTKTQIAQDANDYLMACFDHAVAHCFSAQPTNEPTA